MKIFYLFLLWSTLFQLANGQIAVTLVNENGSLVAQENIEFLTEDRQVLASCVTDSQGRCTITVQNAPTDASGFIRGSLSINDRGQRPVLWPGGKIEIQVMLKGGKVDVPSDAYVTRTPKPEATPTAQEQVTPTASEEQASATATNEQASATATAEQASATATNEQASITATAEQAEATATGEQASATSSILIQFLLASIVVIALAFYIIKSNKKS